MATDASTDKISHILPLLGLTKVHLYPPADKIFRVLIKNGETHRLGKLRHLGALTNALPGARQMRWDYTVAMLYYSSLIKVPGSNARFRVSDIEYSSLPAALQCIALVWNIGHLPGTFSVEKGVYRYLYTQNQAKPADILNWPNGNSQSTMEIRQKANIFLKNKDYLGLARVLVILKLLKFASREDDWFKRWVITFAAPFLLNYEDTTTHQWDKISMAFPIIRHCAYLTLDYSISGLTWGPNVPGLLEAVLSDSDRSLNYISEVVCEVLSPVEREIYRRLYHNEAARREAAIVSNCVYERLNQNKNVSTLICSWLRESQLPGLKLDPKQELRQKCHLTATLTFRSHFSALPDSVVKIEDELREKQFDIPIVFEYRSWNSDVVLEPNEMIVDIISTEKPTTRGVGKLLTWCISRFESFSARPDDYLSMLRKLDLNATYLKLLSRAIELAFPDTFVRFQPWPLAEFGIFKNLLHSGMMGGIWAANSTINDPVSKYIVRNRLSKILGPLKATYTEMLGLSKLRKELRHQWLQQKPRQKCLLITGSVRFTNSNRDLIEFDGGILTVSSRSGKLTWYGLESKSRGTDPKQTLERKIKTLNINASIISIDSKHAYAEIAI